MRRFASRGLDLEQFKEPAISSPIHSFSNVKTVFLPVSSELCVSAREQLECGQLLSRGVRPDSIDSFASVKGVAVAIGEFEFEKFEGQSFLQLDTAEDFKFESYDELETRDLTDDDIMFAARECGILNTTTKTTLSEIIDKYPNGVKNLVIDAVDDEP